MSSEFTKREVNVNIGESMEYQRVMSDNKDSTIAKKEEGSVPSEMLPQSIDHTEFKHGSPKMTQQKPRFQHASEQIWE